MILHHHHDSATYLVHDAHLQHTMCVCVLFVFMRMSASVYHPAIFHFFFQDDNEEIATQHPPPPSAYIDSANSINSNCINSYQFQIKLAKENNQT